jgi:DNA-binding NarL/FixJ family response regulator
MARLDDQTAVLFDPHPLWLDAVERVLRGAGIDVVHKTTSASDAVEKVDQLRPGVLIAELDRSPADPCGTIRRARALGPELRCIVLSNRDDRDAVSAAFEAGAAAYVVKTAHPDDLASAVRQAFDNSVYLRPAAAVGSAPVARPTDDLSMLTRRETEILRLVAEGHSNAQLARMLWVTEQTVKFHLSNIYRKLDVANRTEASRWAQLNGLLETAPARELSVA